MPFSKSFQFVVTLFALLVLSPDSYAGRRSNAGFIQIQHAAFNFFWFETHPKTGLTKDRAGNHAADDYDIASIAATGFALSALPIGVERGWITRAQGEQRALTALRFFDEKLPNHHGWYFHFLNWKTGERAWSSEVSTIDTALFMSGALTAGEYFGGDIRALANKLYQRMDFNWMLTDGGAKPTEKTISMGWRPETGFINSRWMDYNEHLVLNLLAIGSSTHPIPADCWTAWKRQTGEYKGHKTFAIGPLFTHQYTQAYVDLKGRRDALGFDYFESSVQATLANRRFCIEEAVNFPGYGPKVWGISATDASDGSYRAFGAPPGEVIHDGTISPWNTAASIVFTPKEVTAAIRNLRGNHPQLWGRYGFSSAYNPTKKWVAPDIIGIDAGAALLMLENHQTGQIWKLFMAVPEIQTALQRAKLGKK